MKNKIIAELEKSKADVLKNIYSTEESLGHTLLSKEDKSLPQEKIDTYNSFIADIEKIRHTQQTILELDANLKEKKADTEKQKELLSLSEKQLPLLHKQLGVALFLNYSPIYADAFGQAYTNACIEDLKITEAQSKEDTIREGSEKKNFFVKMLNHAKVGVTKTQISSLQQKKDSIILQGGKKAATEGLLESLLQKEQLDADVKSAFLDVCAVNNTITEIKNIIEKLTTESAEIKKSLDEEGVSFTVAKRISTLDSQIEEKQADKNSFAAETGQIFACNYVATNGEAIADFPKIGKEELTSLKIQKESIVTINRSIEIEKIKVEIAEIQDDILALNKAKDSNNEKIERLQIENITLTSKVEEKSEQEKELTSVLANLQAEEAK